MPTVTPMALDCPTTFQWCNVSWMPLLTPVSEPAPAGASPAMLLRLSMSCRASAPPNRPITTGMRPMPSQKYSWPKVYRGTPPWDSTPMSATRRPAAVIRKPLRIWWPDRATTKVRPSAVRTKNSGGPRESTTGRMMGTVAARTAAPIIEPSRELDSTAPSARPLSPRRVRGKPSSAAAAAVASPGIPNSTEVRSPVVDVTTSMPRRKAKASIGCIANVNGSIRANVTGPPSPGRIPTTKPIATPASSRASVPGCST
nr:hypothetical protein [Nocardioides sp.]